MNGETAANGKSLQVQVMWRANVAALLWVQKQDMGPAPRAYHDIAFDPGRGRLVLFGGLVAGKTTGDTWAWYDQTWRQIQDIGPSPRAGHAMANVTSDEGDHITLYGGEAANAFGDTWRLQDRS